jgi:hypothetical protein
MPCTFFHIDKPAVAPQSAVKGATVAINGKTIPILGSHHLAMSVAASMVHQQLNGARITNLEVYTRALNESALALAQIVGVYYEDEHGRRVKIPGDELRNGVFQRGAIELAVGKRTYRTLSILREDFIDAVKSLQEAQAPYLPYSRSTSPGPDCSSE